MKHTPLIIIIPLLMLFASCGGKANTSMHGIADIEQDEWAYDQDAYGGEDVYVCTGGSSKKYHRTPDCRFLENCGKEIRMIDQRFAEEKGRTPCKRCYKI